MSCPQTDTKVFACLISSTKPTDEEHSDAMDLLRCAKNDAKQRFFSQKMSASNIRTELQSVLSDEDMTIVEQITEAAREGMFNRSKDRLMKKFRKL